MTENTNLPSVSDLAEMEKVLDGIPMQTRAAMLLMSIGEADAAEVLKHLGPKEVQRVGTAMSTMPEV